MKRKLAAFLCGLMCVTAFTGCSSTELAYLKMSSDLIDTMSACTVEGTMEAEVDFDAFYEFRDDVMYALEGENYVNDEEPVFSGKKEAAVDYTMHMNLDTLEYDMAFDLKYEGKTYDLGELYYSLDKGVFVSTDLLWSIYQIGGDLTESKDKYILSESFAKELEALLAKEEYIELVSAEQQMGVDMGAVLPEQNMAELYDAVFTFYEEVLKGFETGMVKEISGGYRIEADGHAVAQLLANLLYFIAENPDQVINATEEYMMAVMDAVETGAEGEAAKAELADLFAEARASQDSFVDAAAEMAMLVEMLMEEPAVEMILDSFAYTAAVKKVGDGFDSVAAYTVKHKNDTIFSLVTESTLEKADAQIIFPAKSISVEELTDKLAVIENRYNPITGVSVTWGMYGESGTAEIRTMRSVAEGTYFGQSFNWSDMIVENGRAYLPLRIIAESLGEEVGWENSTKTPYVMQNGERIDMKGKLQDGRAFVALRDFEKLGFKVTYISHKDEYDSYYDYKEALIEKQ